MATEILALDEISFGQAQKELTHNTALRQIEGRSVRVLDKDLTTPPGSPAEGDTYIVATPSAGGWTGHDGEIAHYFGGAWSFYAPVEGVRLWVCDEDKVYGFDGAAWVVSGAGGSVTSVSVSAANGFDATVTNPGTTPSISIETTVTGLLLGNGTGVSAASTADVPGSRTDIDEQIFGFSVSPETTIAFNDATYQFTLAPTGASWSYYRSGLKHTISGSKSVTLPGSPPAANKYFIYIDDTLGTLTQSTTPWTLTDTKVPVAIVAWDNGKTPKYFLMDERHPCNMTRGDHYLQHFTRGTQLSIAPTITGFSAADTPQSKRPSLGASQIADETLFISLASFTPSGAPYNAAEYGLIYRTAASTWTWGLRDMPFPYNAGTNYLQYDNGGVLTDLANNRYGNVYLICSQVSGDFRFAWMPGRGSFTSLALAQAENPLDFSMAGFPIGEYVIAYQVTFLTANGNSSPGKCQWQATKRIAVGNLGLPAAATSSGTLPQGGSAGQLLEKIDSTDYNTQWVSPPADLYGYCPGTYTASQVVWCVPLVRALTVAQNMPGAYWYLKTAATAQTIFDIKVGGVTKGSITFAAAGTTGTITWSNAVTNAAGDLFEVIAPASADATAAGLHFGIPATRS